MPSIIAFLLLCGQPQFVVENKIPAQAIPKPVMFCYVAADESCLPCNAAKRAIRDARGLPFTVLFVAKSPEWVTLRPTFHWAVADGKWKKLQGWHGVDTLVATWRATQETPVSPIVRFSRATHCHRCPVDGTTWCHTDASNGNPFDHACPTCGRLQWKAISR